MAGFGVGASLANMGQEQLGQATKVLAEASNEESKRNAQNEVMRAQEKQGKRQLGGTLGGAAGFAIGAEYGSVGGPWGALIGGALGTVAGGLFSFLAAVLLAVCSAFPSTSEAAVTITQVELHQILTYEPETGIFTWIEPAAKRMAPGDRAGFEKVKPGDISGYRYIKIDGKAYAEHRLAWLYMLGDWPEFELDHRNRNKSDNRFENLRSVTRKQNCENRGPRAGSASGFRGVSWSGGKWCAVIMHFGKQKMLGRFNGIEQAKAARLKAETELFTHSDRSTDA